MRCQNTIQVSILKSLRCRTTLYYALATQPAASLPQASNPNVVQVWLDRLQQQAIVATFFVSIDSLLFSLTSTTRPNNLTDWSNKDLVINASLGGAIIFHVCASILAYIASFVLIRYRLNDAENLEQDTSPPSTRTRPRGSSTRNAVSDNRRADSSHNKRPSSSSILAALPEETAADLQADVLADLRGLVGVYRIHPLEWLLYCGSRSRSSSEKTRNPEGPHTAVAKLQDIVGVLSRAHVVCAMMALLGFVLALLGILIYSWTAIPTSLGIFISVCLGGCGIAASVALW